MKKPEIPSIVQINMTVNSGSTGRIAEALNSMITKQGWKTFTYFGRKKNLSAYPALKIETAAGLLQHVLMTRFLGRHGLSSKSATKSLVRELRAKQPDIIHLHNIHGYYINYPLLFEYLSHTKIPVVWTLHDCWPFTGWCTFSELANCNKWQTHCSKCPLLTEYPKSYVDRSSFHFLLKKKYFNQQENLYLVTVSEWLKKQVYQSFLKNHPSEVIYNGIDTKVFYPKDGKSFRNKYNLSDKFILLGVANSWDERKGLHHFIRMQNSLPKHWKIVLVGISNKASQYIPSSIITISHTEDIYELASIYSGADVLLNLSRNETFGMVTAEAMACGTPVIAFNTCANPELIIKDTGILLEGTSTETIIKAVAEIENIGKSAYSKNCTERIKINFDQTRQFSKYIDLYKRLLNNR